MYDSATPTALALRAYERANLEAQARRARLNQGYGLRDDGTLNDDTSGSIYQTNLGSVEEEQGAETQDRRRGFGVSSGLGARSQTRAHGQSLSRQSGVLRDAFGNIAQTRQDEQNNKGVYEDQLTQINANSANDTAQTLAENLVRQHEAEAAEARSQREIAAYQASQQAAAVPASAPGPTVYSNPLANLFTSQPNAPAAVQAAQAAAQVAALKKNPRAAQTAKNNRY